MLKYVHALILFLLWGMLGRYLSNPESQHWKVAKKVLRYLQGTKNLMLIYRRTNILDVVGFCDADFAGCIDDKKSITGYIFYDGRRSCILEKCQADTYNILNYGGRVCGML